MKTLHVEVMSSGEALKRVTRAWKRASSGKAVDATIGLASIAELTAFLSPRRMELLRHVAQNPGLSIRSLAQALGTDYKNVHTNVAELEATHVLVRDDNGLVTAPYDELVIRAKLRQAA
ncbi:MAG TPA: winged helix-turn-helix transcriptional regulator [Usitatibacter sp.]|nr:winged helix-turn-helix transcriptional regulator [Usitatibacter sp.]